MLTVYQYVIFWSIVFVGVGATWYNFDRRFGVKRYRSWYNLTHKDKLTSDKPIGFIYNRSTHSKAASAALIATIQSILVVRYMDVNLLASLIMWVIEIPLMMLGFYLGPFAALLWQKKEKLFETVDRVESGHIKVGDEVSKAAKRVVAPIKGHLEKIHDALSGDDEPEPVIEPLSADELRLQELEQTDPRELMRKFIDRGGE